MHALKLRPWALSLLVTAGAIAAACAQSAMAATPAGADHAHGHAAPAKLRLDQGRKWQTDAPLREGMTRVRSLVDAQLVSTHAGKATPQQYAALAGQLEVEVGKIVATCKLPPQADAMLHVVIGDLLAASGRMADQAAAAKHEQGLLQAVAAVNDYARHFEHRGFKPLATGH